jgi:two-component system copper resistance phosphate regulon response regulator CusR
MSKYKKILIVDDSKAVHAFVKEALSKLSVEIFSALNGEDGLKAASQQQFDLILLDWDMPVMDGPATLKNLMNLAQKPCVWMMTSHGKMEEIQAMITIGATDYIVKPFTADILVGKISFETGEAA